MRGRPQVALLAGLLLGTLAIRPQLTAVGPLLPEIQEDFEIDHATASLLATIPILCMGAFSLPAARVLRRADVRTAIGWCVAIISVAAIARAVAPAYVIVLALTFPFGIASGVVGALLPAVVKTSFAERPALGTGVYGFGMNVGASLGAALAIPLAHRLGGWRWSLGTMALAGAVTVPVWMRLSRASLGSVRRMDTIHRLPWSSPLAWSATLLFGFQAMCFFGLNAWLADAMVERGWKEAAAGGLVAVLNIAAVPAILVVSILAGRYVSVPTYLVAASLALLAGTIALTQADGAAWAWIALIAFSLGSIFPLSLTISVVIARGPGDAAAVAGMQLGLGYLMAACSPLLLGLLRDSTGSFDAGLWVVAGNAALVVVCAVALVVLLRRRSA